MRIYSADKENMSQWVPYIQPREVHKTNIRSI